MVKSNISNKGDIIRLFDRTPTPRKNTDVVCPHFLNFAWAYGCRFRCAWCYLGGTFRYLSYKTQDHSVPPHFKSREKIAKEVAKFLKIADKPYVLNAGELTDGLVGESLKAPFSKFIMPMFKGTEHKVLFLTKDVEIQNFLENDWQDNAILAWSMNAYEVAARFEKRAPLVIDRIQAAKKVSEAGYTVRVRLDPMVPFKDMPRLCKPEPASMYPTIDWEEAYKRVIHDICVTFTPERVTLGTLRGLPSTIAAALDREWTKYLSESSNWGRKPDIETRFALYKVAIKEFERFDVGKISVCKDTKAMWKLLKKFRCRLDYKNMTCNCLN